MPAATRLRVDFRWEVNNRYFAAHGDLKLLRSEGRKAGSLATPSFFGEFLADRRPRGSDSPPVLAAAMAPEGEGTTVGDLLAVISPVKCSVGARSRGRGDLDHLEQVLGTRFFSVRRTDLSRSEGGGEGGAALGHLEHSEHVRISGPTFQVRQVVEGRLELGAHVVRINRIEEHGALWNEGGVRTDGNFTLDLEDNRKAGVNFVQIYLPDTSAGARARGRSGRQPRIDKRPWHLEVDVTRFEPRPEGIVYETQSRFQFLPQTSSAD